jgi:orotidine-5'-phosphate decarboxylase
MALDFADRLVLRARRLGHPLCVGLDPHLDRIPPLFRHGTMRAGDPETARAVGAFCSTVLDRVAEHCVAIKPQSAFFEQLGAAGLSELEALVRTAREREVPVILDAKRGDIGSTADAYARAYLAEDAPLRADALTVNPYLGGDCLQPFIDAAAAHAGGVFVLVRTSNPGAGDLQDLETQGGTPVYERVAAWLSASASKLVARETRWSSLGVVVGATWPEQARRLRELLPESPFLVPGYGAQGASAADALAGFVRGPDGVLEGGVVNTSRGLIFAPGSDTDDAETWERAIDAALDRAITDLAEAARS